MEREKLKLIKELIECAEEEGWTIKKDDFNKFFAMDSENIKRLIANREIAELAFNFELQKSEKFSEKTNQELFNWLIEKENKCHEYTGYFIDNILTKSSFFYTESQLLKIVELLKSKITEGAKFSHLNYILTTTDIIELATKKKLTYQNLYEFLDQVVSNEDDELIYRQGKVLTTLNGRPFEKILNSITFSNCLNIFNNAELGENFPDKIKCIEVLTKEPYITLLTDKEYTKLFRKLMLYPDELETLKDLLCNGCFTFMENNALPLETRKFPLLTISETPDDKMWMLLEFFGNNWPYLEMISTETLTKIIDKLDSIPIDICDLSCIIETTFDNKTGKQNEEALLKIFEKVVSAESGSEGNFMITILCSPFMNLYPENFSITQLLELLEKSKEATEKWQKSNYLYNVLYSDYIINKIVETGEFNKILELLDYACLYKFDYDEKNNKVKVCDYSVYKNMIDEMLHAIPQATEDKIITKKL